jgi:hypothetical protein
MLRQNMMVGYLVEKEAVHLMTDRKQRKRNRLETKHSFQRHACSDLIPATTSPT